MKVRFLQSGGFVGVVKGYELDTTALAPKLTREIKRLVRDSGISISGQYLSDSARDLQQYEITIEDGDRVIAVTFDDASIPQPARRLVGFLKRHARPEPLK